MTFPFWRIRFFLLLILLPAWAVAAPDGPAKAATTLTSSEQQARIEQLQERLQALENDLQAQKNAVEIMAAKLEFTRGGIDSRMYDFSNLLSSQSTHTTWVGNLVAIGAIISTLLVFVGTFATYVSTGNRAKREARGVAKKWFAEKTDHLEQEIEVLLAKAEAAQESIASHHDKVLSDAQTASKVMQDATAEAQAFMRVSKAKEQPGLEVNQIDTQSSAFVHRANESLKSKPEKDFTPDEHYIRGASLYHSGNLQAALDSFEAALVHATNAPSVDQVKYLMARAFTLDALHRYDEANATYDQIDERFSQDPSDAVREQVATGLFNKGISLGELGQFNQAIAVYGYLDYRFGEDSAPQVREQVAKGLFNKGYKLGKQGKIEDEIAVYDDVARRFSPEYTPAMRSHLVRALNHLGVQQIRLAKANWNERALKHQHLKAAAAALERALSQCVPEESALIRSDQYDRASVCGNLAYCLFLSDEQHAAKEPLHACLKLGGHELLDAQRAHLALNRLEPQDTQFDGLLEQIWVGLQE
ncbi:MAG: hypothetical protein RL748_3945 [Pseudomonadota bacterium]|jgi:tetratricopeptide (TPR) repeat protein